MNAYVARRRGTAGCEIVSPEGKVIAWTTDEYWGSLVAWLLNGTNVVARPLPTKSEDLPDDQEPTAREAISHLAFHGVALGWDLPGETSEAVKKLIATYFSDGEIASTLSEMACRYVMKALADDHLGISGIEIASASPSRDVGVRHHQDEIGEETRPDE